jgi:FtsZ-binding cell division protein ZapB
MESRSEIRELRSVIAKYKYRYKKAQNLITKLARENRNLKAELTKKKPALTERIRALFGKSKNNKKEA